MRCCNVCETDFETDEGGIAGVIGEFVTVSLCPLCFDAIRDECDKMRPPVPCQRCGHLYESEEADA